MRQSQKRPPVLTRLPSVLDDEMLPWEAYRTTPTQAHGSVGFNAAGVQRLDLPHGPHELEAVAAALQSSDALGLAALGPFHRLGTPDRLKRWRDEFGSLDLGAYDDVTAAPADSRAGRLFASLRWSLLLVQPNRFFPAHQHPDVEVEFVLRGALYENRLLAQPDRQIADGALPDPGMPKLFRVARHAGGSFFSNPRWSVHQSYTLDEGVVILVLWAGTHTNLTDRRRALWDEGRCQNPLCPLAGHQVREYLERKPP